MLLHYFFGTDPKLKGALNQYFAGGHWYFTTNTLFKKARLTVKKNLEKKNELNMYLHFTFFKAIINRPGVAGAILQTHL